MKYDAIIVGARCAGAATALLLAQKGMKVLAVEQARYGSDTLSTHALMRGAVLQLHRFGVLEDVVAAGTPAIRSTTFHYGDDAIRIPIKAKHGVDALYAPRRTVLDRILVDAAREAGAEIFHGTRVTDLVRSPDGRVRGVFVEDSTQRFRRAEASIVIGADGTRSKTAELVGASTYRLGKHASAFGFAYLPGLDIEGFHWYYSPGLSAAAIPTNDGQTVVGAIVPQERFLREMRFDLEAEFRRVLSQCAPGLAEQVDRAPERGPIRGYPGILSFLRQSHGPGWALVGDAGYFRDPLTAHGITDALRDAELLARAVLQGTDRALREYQETRDALALRFFEVTDRIASFDWDLESVKEMHLVMSEEMNKEVAAILELGELRRVPSVRPA
jgi:flavin-dependent dehydrogenase